MTIEKKSLKIDDTQPSGHDHPLAETTIADRESNANHQRLKLQEALKSYKLTNDGQQRFVIDLGNGISARDTRPVRNLSEISKNFSSAVSSANPSEISSSPAGPLSWLNSC